VRRPAVGELSLHNHRDHADRPAPHGMLPESAAPENAASDPTRRLRSTRLHGPADRVRVFARLFAIRDRTYYPKTPKTLLFGDHIDLNPTSYSFQEGFSGGVIFPRATYPGFYPQGKSYKPRGGAVSFLLYAGKTPHGEYWSALDIRWFDQQVA